ncbi:MAG: putative glyoxalase family protein [Cryobacterium sp.]|jgi:predicted enzyme related to lactoylglutathione lyase|nr:putative glyoxalase family protein [Cryobacterium sp.]
MPERDKARLGEPCWVDLTSANTAAVRDFYSTLFGWTTTEASDEYGNYITFWQDGEQVAGLTAPMPGIESPKAWMTYMSTADADATTRQAREAGAQVLAEPMTVGDQGRMAILADSSGAVIGLWQSAEHTGYGRYGEVGTPVWHELITKDFDAATAFYENVFGWELQPLSDTAEFRYSTFGPGGMIGGIYDGAASLSGNEPSNWSVYFGVPDVAGAAARVAQLGGTVLREPWDSEYGTFSQVSDPEGAVFLLSSVESPGTTVDDEVSSGLA